MGNCGWLQLWCSMRRSPVKQLLYWQGRRENKNFRTCQIKRERKREECERQRACVLQKRAWLAVFAFQNGERGIRALAAKGVWSRRPANAAPRSAVNSVIANCQSVHRTLICSAFRIVSKSAQNRRPKIQAMSASCRSSLPLTAN